MVGIAIVNDEFAIKRIVNPKPFGLMLGSKSLKRGTEDLAVSKPK